MSGIDLLCSKLLKNYNCQGQWCQQFEYYNVCGSFKYDKGIKHEQSITKI